MISGLLRRRRDPHAADARDQHAARGRRAVATGGDRERQLRSLVAQRIDAHREAAPRMVLKRTVFVLGAGASLAYGFPSGQELLTDLIGMRTVEHPAVQLLDSCGFDFDAVQDFRAALEASPRFSVDAFLQSRATFRELGKHAIAALLLPREGDHRLRPSLEQEWMRYLFNQMLPSDPADLQLNQLAVLTFNFDRSYGRALWLALKAEYGLNDADAARFAQPFVPPHVHGDLGEADWLVGRGRPYGGTVGAADVKAAASRIKIVFEEIPTETTLAIRRVLSDARRVCFLGFGYHKDNLRKLGVPASIATATVQGTIFDIAAGELSGIKREFGTVALRDVGNSDILQFLRRSDALYDD